MPGTDELMSSPDQPVNAAPEKNENEIKLQNYKTLETLYAVVKKAAGADEEDYIRRQIAEVFGVNMYQITTPTADKIDDSFKDIAIFKENVRKLIFNTYPYLRNAWEQVKDHENITKFVTPYINWARATLEHDEGLDEYRNNAARSVMNVTAAILGLDLVKGQNDATKKYAESYTVKQKLEDFCGAKKDSTGSVRFSNKDYETFQKSHFSQFQSKRLIDEAQKDQYDVIATILRENLSKESLAAVFENLPIEIRNSNELAFLKKPERKAERPKDTVTSTVNKLAELSKKYPLIVTPEYATFIRDIHDKDKAGTSFGAFCKTLGENIGNQALQALGEEVLDAVSDASFDWSTYLPGLETTLSAVFPSVVADTNVLEDAPARTRRQTLEREVRADTTEETETAPEKTESNFDRRAQYTLRFMNDAKNGITKNEYDTIIGLMKEKHGQPKDATNEAKYFYGVKNLQTALNALPSTNPKLAEDGAFGERTLAALRASGWLAVTKDAPEKSVDTPPAAATDGEKKSPDQNNETAKPAEEAAKVEQAPVAPTLELKTTFEPIGTLPKVLTNSELAQLSAAELAQTISGLIEGKKAGLYPSVLRNTENNLEAFSNSQVHKIPGMENQYGVIVGQDDEKGTVTYLNQKGARVVGGKMTTNVETDYKKAFAVSEAEQKTFLTELYKNLIEGPKSEIDKNKKSFESSNFITKLSSDKIGDTLSSSKELRYHTYKAGETLAVLSKSANKNTDKTWYLVVDAQGQRGYVDLDDEKVVLRNK